MAGRIIEIGSPGHLSVRNRQLVLRRGDEPEVTLVAEDIAALILDHPQITLSVGVGRLLAGHGAALIICGENHHPQAVQLPYAAHGLSTQRLHAQIGMSEPLRKRLWQSVVQAKLHLQGLACAALNDGKDEGLAALARRVRSGDPDNLEAQGAQRYWPALFGKGFRRDRETGGANAMLNYASAILRALTARALVGAGLWPALGIHHHQRGNAFCLADDLMEPCRTFFDLIVAAQSRAGAVPDALGKEEKRALLSALHQAVPVGERRYPLLEMVQMSASALAAAIEAGDPSLLVFPDGLPGGLASTDLAEEGAEEERDEPQAQGTTA